MSADYTERLKWAAHEAECKAAAMAVLAERKRARPKTSASFSPADNPRMVALTAVPDDADIRSLHDFLRNWEDGT